MCIYIYIYAFCWNIQFITKPFTLEPVQNIFLELHIKKEYGYPNAASNDNFCHTKYFESHNQVSFVNLYQTVLSSDKHLKPSRAAQKGCFSTKFFIELLFHSVPT